MKTPTVSVRNLLAVVLVVALDCALARYILVDDDYFPFQGWPTLFRFGFTGSLPAVSLLAIGGIMLFPFRERVRDWPFLTGFVLSGAVALVAFLALALVLPWEWFIPLFAKVNSLSWDLFKMTGFDRSSYELFMYASEVFAFSVVFAVPELLVAVTGGLLTRARWLPRVVPSPIG